MAAGLLPAGSYPHLSRKIRVAWEVHVVSLELPLHPQAGLMSQGLQWLRIDLFHLLGHPKAFLERPGTMFFYNCGPLSFFPPFFPSVLFICCLFVFCFSSVALYFQRPGPFAQVYG